MLALILDQAFLLTNFVLTGPPLFLFILFTVTVLIFAIVVALIVGLLVAVGFTLFSVCVALLVLFPTIFFTTLAATFFFLWGMGGYYILKYLNKGGDSPAPQGGAIGDKLNSLTGGRLNFIMGPAREEEAKNEKNNNPATTPDKAGKSEKEHATSQKKAGANGPQKLNGIPNGVPNGAPDFKKHADTVKKNANVGNATQQISDNASVDGVTNKTGLSAVSKQAGAGDVTNKLGGTTGTLKGTVGGATGLA